MGIEFIVRGDISLLSFYYLFMRTLKESILTSIGQGDRYFEEIYKKYNLNPKKVHRNKDGSIDYDGSVKFYCEDFEKLPIKFDKVDGCFECIKCTKLTSLEGCPKEVRLWFDCSGCINLPSLEGSPTIVRSFACQNCDSLTSLKGCPEKVLGSFDCGRCRNLTSLEGSPKEVGRNFICIVCPKLTSLEGCPKKVGGDFYSRDCGRKFKKDEVNELSDVKGKIHV